MPLTPNQKHLQKIKMRERRESIYKKEELAGLRPIYIKQIPKNQKLIEKMKVLSRGTTLGSFMKSENKSDYHRIYYLQHYERLQKKRKEIMTCITCGHTYLRANRARHRKSTVHIACLGDDYEEPLKKKRDVLNIDGKTKLSNKFCKEKIKPLTISFD
tara:strand:- start:302 stop:775 length:474 start_codon:yes stop_codon:yes gene_type:complete